MMARSQHWELQTLEGVLHDRLGDFEAIPVAPFRLEEMKSQLIAFRGCVDPRPQAATADKFAALFFKHRPVLDAVLLPTNHLSPQLVAHFFISEGSAEKRHHVGISPEAFGEM